MRPELKILPERAALLFDHRSGRGRGHRCQGPFVGRVNVQSRLRRAAVQQRQARAGPREDRNRQLQQDEGGLC